MTTSPDAATSPIVSSPTREVIFGTVPHDVNGHGFTIYQYDALDDLREGYLVQEDEPESHDKDLRSLIIRELSHQGMIRNDRSIRRFAFNHFFGSMVGEDLQYYGAYLRPNAKGTHLIGSSEDDVRVEIAEVVKQRMMTVQLPATETRRTPWSSTTSPHSDSQSYPMQHSTKKTDLSGVLDMEEFEQLYPTVDINALSTKLPVDFNYDITLREMRHRRFLRLKGGAYRKSKASRTIWMFGAFIVVVAFIMTLLLQRGALKNVEIVKLVFFGVICIGIPIFIVVLIPNSSLFVRLMIAEFVIATFVVFIVSLLFEVDNPNADPLLSKQYTDALWSVFAIWIAAEICTIIAWIIIMWLYPKIIYNGRGLDTLNKWFRIEPVHGKRWMYTYSAFEGEAFITTRQSFTYTGAIHPETHVPHGVGEWREDGQMGECIVGMWNHGRPIAPFRSREYGSGNSFSALRIGFAQNNPHAINAHSSRVRRDERGLRWGVLNVECSVAGQFSRHLPQVTTVMQPAYKIDGLTPDAVLNEAMKALYAGQAFAASVLSPGPLPWEYLIGISPLQNKTQRDRFLDRMGMSVEELTGILPQSPITPPPPEGFTQKHVIENAMGPCAADGPIIPASGDAILADAAPVSEPVETIGESSGTMHIHMSGYEKPGYIPEDVTKKHGGITASEKVIKEKNPFYGPNSIPEAVIIIHGFWANLEDAATSFGQMLCMCDLPPRFKVFAFDYPSGNPSCYRSVKRYTGSAGVRHDLVEMVRDLTRCGFTRFHFIAHSMGTRVFSQLAECMSDLFQPLPNTGLVTRPCMKTGLPDTNLPECKSIILIDGEFSLKQFKEKKFPILRRFCSLITNYCDVEDMALRGAEWINKAFDKEEDPRDIGKNPDAFWESSTMPEWEVEQLIPPKVLEIMETAKQDSQSSSTLDRPWEPQHGAKPGAIDYDPFGYRGDPLLDPLHIELRVVPGNPRSATLDTVVDVNMTFEGARAKGRLMRSRAKVPYKPAFLNSKRYLDLDVIDNSHIDTNVSAIRHSTFVYNRLLTDDFRDIIVHGRRAVERGRAIRKGTNYTFVELTFDRGQLLFAKCRSKLHFSWLNAMYLNPISTSLFQRFEDGSSVEFVAFLQLMASNGRGN